MTLTEFVDKLYLPFLEEKRASTRKGYEEIWTNHIRDRVGAIKMRNFRTVNANRMLRAIADENDLSKTTLQHIKAVLSAIFTHAKNEGAFDGANSVQGTRIPNNAREPAETYAYNLAQICRILEFLPLLHKAIVATAAFAGLRSGKLVGLEWTDYSGTGSVVASCRTCMNWERTRRLSSASCVMQNRTSRRIATSRRSTRPSWQR